MTTPDGAADHNRSSGVDRRTLLRRAAAAGTIGLVAPISIDSILSPAAACSAPQLTASVLIGTNGWARDSNGAGGTGAGAFDGDPATDSSQRYRATSTFNVAARSLVVVSAAVYWSNATAPVPTITGGGLSFSAPTVLRFDTNIEAARGYLIVWTARNNTASAVSSVRVIINLGAGQGDGFVGQVVQLVRTGTPVAPQAGAIGTTSAQNQLLTTATPFVEVTGTLSPGATASGELMFAAALADDDALAEALVNNLQAATWTSTAYGSALAQNFTDGGVVDSNPDYGTAYDVTMASFFRTTHAGSRTARLTAAASPAGQPPLDLSPAVVVDLGTVALEVTCA